MIEIRFHGPLNELLPARSRGRTLSRSVKGEPSVKDLIESLGVPHVEVDVIVVDGRSVGFGHRVPDGERIEVHPVHSDGGASSVIHLAPPQPEPGRIRFACDGHLGRLAAYLRMLGIDTAYANRADDDALAALASHEDRTLLTQDRGLLKRAVIRHGYVVRSARPADQLREVAERFGLAAASRPFSRCLRCNSLLEPVDPSEARLQVPPRVAAEQAQYRRCPSCSALYWRGSHHARMQRLIEQTIQGE